MPVFSPSSLEKLQTCHPDLQILFNEVIEYFDCTVTEGLRDQAAQDKAYAQGNSTLKWPKSKHNHSLSLAVDVYPCPIDMKDQARFYYFAGFVMGMAKQLKRQGRITHNLRYGGDWDKDTKLKDNTFNDLVHFELVP